MNKYIDAEKLTKAIENKGLDCSFALKMERLDTLALINELQQEQPEVDLEKEIEQWFDLSGIGEAWEYGEWSIDDVTRTARHFYELGLNARKEK